MSEHARPARDHAGDRFQRQESKGLPRLRFWAASRRQKIEALDGELL
jgi:hypothetical protein